MSAISIISLSGRRARCTAPRRDPPPSRRGIASRRDDPESAVLERPDEDRLEHALALDRGLELGQIADAAPRLVGVGDDLVDRICRPSDGPNRSDSESTKCESWRMCDCMGRPRRLDTGQHLLGKGVVLGRRRSIAARR
jgi:hypothetical protein